MKVNTDKNKIEKLVNSRYVERIFPSKKEFKEALGRGEQLKFYIGIDPTAPQLHLGHSTNFLLLKKLQEMGHRVIFLIGDFTAKIGDPTGKSTARKALSDEEILKNWKDYKNQAAKILDFESKKNPIEIKFNNKWYKEFDLKETIKLMAKITHGQLIKRDMFQKRIDEGKEIYFHELIYPLLQGYDSVVMEVDGEIGGNDQTFNMLVGRDLVKEYQNREKFVITTKLLINPKTNKKLMSKSEGGYVALNDPPKEMFGKIMALPDEVILTCFELCAEISPEKIKEIKKEFNKKSTNPRDIKAELAKEIVAIYHGKEAAKKAEKEFERVFKENKLPSNIPTFETEQEKYPIVDLLVDSRLISSKSKAKRLIKEGAVKIKIGNKQLKVKNWKQKINITKKPVIRAGKRKFLKIKHVK